MKRKDQENGLLEQYSDIPTPLSFLFRQTSLSDEEYVQLIMTLIGMIDQQKESIIQTSLNTFDSKENNPNGFGILSDYNIPQVKGLPLSTRGIWVWRFYPNPELDQCIEAEINDHRSKCWKKIDRVWGYTRQGNWAVADITYLKEYEYPGMTRRPNRQILMIDTRNVCGPQELARIVDINVADIYWKLTLAIYYWHDRRRELYNAATYIQGQSEMIAREVSRIDNAMKSQQE